MKFKFRLQTVFDLKQHLENEQKDVLLRERNTLDELVNEEQKLKGKFLTWSKRYIESANCGMSPIEAVRMGQYLEELQKNIEKVAKSIERQNAVVERERLLLIERMKDRKTMETLYGRQLERFDYEEGRKQEKELEELISSRR